MKEKDNFKVGCSPITSRIFAGKVTKTGLWAKNRQDVTDMAVGAVAQCLLQKEEKLLFEHNGKKYELLVLEVK